MYTIELNIQQHRWPIDADRLQRAVQQVLADAGVQQAEVSLAVVDNATIWQLNRRHLQHDYPTDVLSFRLDEHAPASRPADPAGDVVSEQCADEQCADDQILEGQLVVSAEMAAERAAEFGWSADDELMLYVVHGTLHLVGYDDHGEEDRQVMRAAEVRHLAALGIHVSHPRAADSRTGTGGR